MGTYLIALNRGIIMLTFFSLSKKSKFGTSSFFFSSSLPENGGVEGEVTLSMYYYLVVSPCLLDGG